MNSKNARIIYLSDSIQNVYPEIPLSGTTSTALLYWLTNERSDPSGYYLECLINLLIYIKLIKQNKM